MVKHFGLGEYAVVYHKFNSDLDSPLYYFFCLIFSLAFFALNFIRVALST